MTESRPIDSQGEPASLLEKIDTPEDLKRLPVDDLPAVCDEVRQFLLDSVQSTGGHLGSGLGVVELTTALHYLFDFRRDRLVWDVSHQCYPHKVLTGRRGGFPELRRTGECVIPHLTPGIYTVEAVSGELTATTTAVVTEGQQTSVVLGF